MAQAANDSGLNPNRAICNAMGDAERAEMEPDTRSQDVATTMMKAIFLQEHVKALSDVKPSLIPRPTFDTYLASSRKQKRLPPTEPLIHIKITHTAINHVDLLYAHGVHQNNKSGLVAPPFVLGLEFSGIVIDVHYPQQQGCSFKVGDKVFGGSTGTHAEELIVPASAVHHLPSSTWSLHDIAALGAATIPVSYGALTTIGGLKADETVLVHAAAGGLGVYAIQIAKALGAKVIGTVGSQHKISIVENLLRNSSTGQISEGEGVINYSLDGWEGEVLNICKQAGKDGVDVVYDTVGLVQRSIKCTTFNGRIVVAGFAGRTGTGAEKVQELEKIAVNRILLKQIKLLGYRFGETGRRLPGETVKIWDGLNKMLTQEPRVIQPIVYKTYKGLDLANEAMRALHERKVFGKAVVEVCSEEEAMNMLYQTSKQSSSRNPAKL